MLNQLYSLLLVLSIGRTCNGFDESKEVLPSADICDKLRPTGWNATSQDTTYMPFRMHMQWALRPHLLIIHILGNEIFRFYGFILQARHRGTDEIFGEFDDDEQIHRLDCHSGVRNTVYLLHNYLKIVYDIHWISPVIIMFPVIMHATIVEARNVFWTFSMPLPPYIDPPENNLVYNASRYKYYQSVVFWRPPPEYLVMDNIAVYVTVIKERGIFWQMKRTIPEFYASTTTEFRKREYLYLYHEGNTPLMVHSNRIKSDYYY